MLLDQHVRAVVDCGVPAFLFIVADNYSCALVELGQAVAAAHIIGANDVMRERTKVNRRPDGERGLKRAKEECLAILGSTGWELEYTAGRSCRLDSLLLETATSPDVSGS